MCVLELVRVLEDLQAVDVESCIWRITSRPWQRLQYQCGGPRKATKRHSALTWWPSGCTGCVEPLDGSRAEAGWYIKFHSGGHSGGDASVCCACCISSMMSQWIGAMTMDEGKYRFWTQELVYGVVVVREGIAIADHEIETCKNSAHLDCKGMRHFAFLIYSRFWWSVITWTVHSQYLDYIATQNYRSVNKGSWNPETIVGHYITTLYFTIYVTNHMPQEGYQVLIEFTFFSFYVELVLQKTDCTWFMWSSKVLK